MAYKDTKGERRRESILPVATGYNRGIGTLLVCLLEETDGFVDSSCACAVGQGIGHDVGSVCATDTLDPDIVRAVLAREGICDGGSGRNALANPCE